MIQNHALQLLTMVAMEPPSTQRRRRDPRREAQGAALAQALHRRERRPRRGARPVPRRHHRRQAGAGLSRGGQGAARQPHARPSSRCAPRCRTGAGPACRSTCAPASGWPSATRRSSSTSGPTPHAIFRRRRTGRTSWSSSCSPRTGSSCTCWRPRAPAQRASRWRRCPSTSTSTRPSPTERVGAYERLLLDAIAGRLNLFVRSDEQEQAWRWVEPILEAWAARRQRRRGRTRAGTWGPAAASALVARDGYAWSEEQ